MSIRESLFSWIIGDRDKELQEQLSQIDRRIDLMEQRILMQPASGGEDEEMKKWKKKYYEVMERLDELENRLEPILKKQQQALEWQQRELEKQQQELGKQRQELGKQQQAMAAVSSERDRLQKYRADLEVTISNQNVEIKELKKKIAELERRNSVSILSDSGSRTPVSPASGSPLSETQAPEPLISEPAYPESVVPPYSRIFWLTKNQDVYPVSLQNLQAFAEKLCDLSIVDQYLESASDKNAAYVKLTARYRDKIAREVEHIDWEDVTEDEEIEDTLRQLLSVLHKELLKGIFRPLYRGLRESMGGFELGLLKAYNQYLEDNGFYSRNTTRIGEIASPEKDYKDMEPVRDEWSGGKKHGEILEVELLPYYLNYINEKGEKASVCTQGSMIVAA